MDLSWLPTAWIIVGVVNLDPRLTNLQDVVAAVSQAHRNVNDRWDGHGWLARAPERQAGRSAERLFTTVFTIYAGFTDVNVVYKPRGDLMFDIRVPTRTVQNEFTRGTLIQFAEECLIECCQQAARRWRTPIEESGAS